MPIEYKSSFNLTRWEQSISDTVDALSRRENVDIKIWTAEDIRDWNLWSLKGNDLRSLAGLFCRRVSCASSEGSIMTVPAYLKDKQTEQGYKMFIGIQYADIGLVDNRIKSRISHELCHAYHVLKFKYSANDLDFILKSASKTERLVDICFHPYVYRMQVDCGVPVKMLYDEALPYNNFDTYDHAKDSLNGLLSLLPKEEVVARIELHARPCNKYLIKVVDVVAPGYELDLDWDGTRHRIIECYSILSEMYVDCSWCKC